MENNCIIDFTKPKGYKTKDWLAMEEKENQCKGRIKKWRSANSKEFTFVKNKKLYINGKETIKNDVGMWGCDYGSGDTCATSTFIDKMKEVMPKFKIKKRSDGKYTYNF